jgi:hypothetical protein
MSPQKKLHKHLFRLIPPKEFIEEVLRSCGFEAAFADRRFVTKGGLQVGVRTHETWLPLLEPYYLPCKAKRFFGSAAGEFDTGRLVTVLRHVLRPYDHDLVAQEVADHGTKQTLYQIQPVLTHSVSAVPEMEVSFS